MPTSQHIQYTALKNVLGEVLFRPLVTIEMIHRDQRVAVAGLVDSGADVNVMPYALGTALGLVWENQPSGIRLSGNLASVEARGVVISAQVGEFVPTDLAFAWVQSAQAPLIFGHTNFFEVFDICFYRTERYFSLTQKAMS